MVEIAQRTPAADSPGKTARRTANALLLPVSFVCLIVVWELLVRQLQIPIYFIPPPSKVVVSLWSMAESGLLLKHAIVTFTEAFGGFALAILAAALFATLIAESKLCERLLYPYFAALQSMPKVAIAPLIVIWFGFGMTSKIVLSGLLAFFPILVNFVQGLKAADPGRLKLMQALDASRWQTLRLVRIPYALPFFLVGIELGCIYSMLGAIVGEFVGSSEGIGHWLMALNMNIDTASMFALLVLLAGYGMTIQRSIGRLRRKLLFWAQTDLRKQTEA